MVLDGSFVMQAVTAVSRQQKLRLEDKECISVLKQSRTPVKLFCTLFIQEASKGKLHLVDSALKSSCEFCLHGKTKVKLQPMCSFCNVVLYICGVID